ncbi:cysteine-rich CWC family protein [Marinomonas sp. RS-M-Aa-14]|uniref:cysteine-rich CWC family protein n=1 Tax=Marinomonas TaxID=28253 RepID=UPI00390CA7F2
MKCPFCLGDNACTVDSHDGCWCFTLHIPSDMLEWISTSTRLAGKERVCICSACIHFYKTDRRGFLLKYAN